MIEVKIIPSKIVINLLHLFEATLMEFDLSITQVTPIIIFRIGQQDGVLLIRTKFND
tara:strand:+ start:595 stop:765 length:171 start_codon:yes stop_codon:yes gene_type:complete